MEIRQIWGCGNCGQWYMTGHNDNSVCNKQYKKNWAETICPEDGGNHEIVFYSTNTEINNWLTIQLRGQTEGGGGDEN